MREKLKKIAQKLGLRLDRQEAGKALRFIVGLAVAFIIISFIVSLIPLEFLEYFYANAALLLLGIFGIRGSILFGEPVLIMLDSYALPVAVSYLCTGLLETAVIAAAIAASFGIPHKKRLLGIAGAVITTAAFNIARIAASIYITLSLGLEAGELSHGILFRLFLLLVIAGYYALWLAWATSRKGGDEG